MERVTWGGWPRPPCVSPHLEARWTNEAPAGPRGAGSWGSGRTWDSLRLSARTAADPGALEADQSLVALLLGNKSS